MPVEPFPGDPSFLAGPCDVADWRVVVLLEVATETGLLSALPGTPDELAGRSGTDPRSTRIVLDALTVYGIVCRDSDGSFQRGPSAPDRDTAAVLHQHAGVITRWATSLQDRVRGVPQDVRPGRAPDELARWLDSLGRRARQRAPDLVDACLAAVAGVESVLDLGGGHGEYALEFARRGLKVTMQDRPAVIDLARGRGTLEAAGVEMFAGDFFEAVADGPFDLVLLAGVAHTYPAPALRQLYERVRPAVGHALVISTFLRDADDRSRLFAVQMLSVANGGDTHSRDEHVRWLRDAGFVDIDGIAANVETTGLLMATTAGAADNT